LTARRIVFFPAFNVNNIAIKAYINKNPLSTMGCCPRTKMDALNQYAGGSKETFFLALTGAPTKKPLD
jgi:hypothetical protein